MSHIHIPDGVLPVWLWALGWILSLALVGVAGLVAERTDARRKVPLLGVVAALMLVAMSSEIVPIAYHLNFTVAAGILLGPVLSIIAAFIVQVVLGMLGHGGVTVLGLNATIVALEMVVGWALFRGLVRLLTGRRVRWAAGLATALTLALSTTLLVGIVWIGGSAATSRETGALDPADLRFENPFAAGVFSVGLFSGGEHAAEDDARQDEEPAHEQSPPPSIARFAAIVYTLGPIGWLIEALITAGAIGYIAGVRPALVFSGALAAAERHIPGDEAGGL
jgi:cobalt/nickel transport system permease protein